MPEASCGARGGTLVQKVHRDAPSNGCKPCKGYTTAVLPFVAMHEGGISAVSIWTSACFPLSSRDCISRPMFLGQHSLAKKNQIRPKRSPSNTAVHLDGPGMGAPPACQKS